MGQTEFSEVTVLITRLSSLSFLW